MKPLWFWVLGVSPWGRLVENLREVLSARIGVSFAVISGGVLLGGYCGCQLLGVWPDVIWVGSQSKDLEDVGERGR